MMTDDTASIENEMEAGDSFGLSSLLQMESPPVHLILSGPLEAENKGEYSKALRLYEDLEAILDERLQGSYADRAMMDKEEIREIAGKDKLLNTAIFALDTVLEGTPQFPDNFVLFLNEHFKRQQNRRRNASSSDDDDDELSLENSEVVRRVKYGIIRNLLRLWRIDEGLQLMDNIYRIDDPDFFVECGDIIMKHGNFESAGYLYERGCNIPKAVEAFILSKDFKRAQLVLEDNTPNPEGWKIMAQAKETEGEFEEAAKYYGICGDIDAAVKIYLQLKLPEEALLLLKSFPTSVSPSSVESVAEFLLKSGESNKETALDLLISLGRVQQASAIAESHGLQKDLVEKVYRTYVLEKQEEIPPEFDIPLNEVILSLMSKKSSDSIDVDLDCGTSFALLGKYEASYPLLLKVIQDSAGQPEASGNETRAWAFLKLIAANTKDKSVTETIIKVMEKSPTHLCDFFVLEKRWLDAAKVKKSLSEEFLRNGRVKPAYASIVEGMRFLFRRDTSSSSGAELDLHENSRDLVEYLDYFHILHSFRLMTMHASLKSFATAAYLAYRLRNNLDRFPKEIQSLILSSGAMYAHTSHCGGIGKELAVRLMKDKELISHVSDKHKSAIENIIRKNKTGAPILASGTEKSCCPRCKAYVDVWLLQCPNCAMLMSMCVISGKHLSGGEITSCRLCHFPMNQSELENFVKLGLEVCPICKDQMVSLPDPEMFQYCGSSYYGHNQDDEEDYFDNESEEQFSTMLTHRPSFTNYMNHNNYEDSNAACEYFCDAEADERQMDARMRVIMSARHPSGGQPSYRIANTSHPSASGFVPNSPSHFSTMGTVHHTPRPRMNNYYDDDPDGY